MAKKQTSTDNIIKIIGAVLGVISAILVAYITYRGITDPIRLSIGATQTAEARSLVKAELPVFTTVPTQAPAPTATPLPTETITPTLTQTLTPMPLVIADTTTLVGWVPNFNFSKVDNTKNHVDISEDAIRFAYDVGNDSYVLITKGVDAGELSGTQGISFVYKGEEHPIRLNLN